MKLLKAFNVASYFALKRICQKLFMKAFAVSAICLFLTMNIFGKEKSLIPSNQLIDVNLSIINSEKLHITSKDVSGIYLLNFSQPGVMLYDSKLIVKNIENSNSDYMTGLVADSIKKSENKVITYSQVWNQFLVIKEELEKSQSYAKDSVLNYDGMVIDETQSKMGKDFYDMFYKEWDSPKHVLNYTIVVKEKPVPSLGTQVMVFIDDKNIFQSFLQPRFEIIENAAYQAVAYAKDYLTIYHKTLFK